MVQVSSRVFWTWEAFVILVGLQHMTWTRLPPLIIEVSYNFIKFIICHKVTIPKLVLVSKNPVEGKIFFWLIWWKDASIAQIDFYRLPHLWKMLEPWRTKGPEICQTPDILSDTPRNANMSLKRGTISIGKTSSNHWFSGDMLVFGCVLLQQCSLNPVLLERVDRIRCVSWLMLKNI